MEIEKQMKVHSCALIGAILLDILEHLCSYCNCICIHLKRQKLHIFILELEQSSFISTFKGSR